MKSETLDRALIELEKVEAKVLLLQRVAEVIQGQDEQSINIPKGMFEASKEDVEALCLEHNWTVKFAEGRQDTILTTLKPD